jgi:hypothetical protein|tara:strand:+ start:42 stop:353 length:312 start_codon:yes stop_codon:yes gene_type:complete
MRQDIQATRSAAAAGATAIIASPVRVYSISIACTGGAGVLELTTTSNSGTTLLYADVPTGEMYTLNFGGGILFPAGVFCKTKTNIAGYTLFTDRFSAPGLTAG